MRARIELPNGSKRAAIVARFEELKQEQEQVRGGGLASMRERILTKEIREGGRDVAARRAWNAQEFLGACSTSRLPSICKRYALKFGRGFPCGGVRQAEAQRQLAASRVEVRIVRGGPSPLALPIGDARVVGSVPTRFPPPQEGPPGARLLGTRSGEARSLTPTPRHTAVA